MMDWATMNQAERDAAYNNSAAVANSAEYMAELRTASEAVREEFPDEMDQEYGPRERNRVDLIAGEATTPCLLFIHGGYWQRNSRDGFTALGDGVRAHGWSVAFPGYTLAPEATMTEIVAEISAAIDWVRANTAGPIILSGWSAGGHLTAMALGHPAVHAALAISGVYDLGPIRDTYLNEKARITEAEAAQLSPLRLPVVPKRMDIAYGTAEVPPIVHDSRHLHGKRSDAGAAGMLIPVPEANHFTALDSLRDPDGLLTRALLALV